MDETLADLILRDIHEQARGCPEFIAQTIADLAITNPTALAAIARASVIALEAARVSAQLAQFQLPPPPPLPNSLLSQLPPPPPLPKSFLEDEFQE